MTLYLWRVKTPSGETVLQLTEETAKRDYPDAVRIDPEAKQKQAAKPKNKAAAPPLNKSA